ncbi:MAG: non-homologous end-joining DNA ligase [Jatrophihabitans sp.]
MASSRRVPVPGDLQPMLATLGELPPPRSDAMWGYEMKWDGVRALVRIESGRVNLMSRNGLDMAVAYPELQPLGGSAGKASMLVDGEIVSLGADGRPSFGRLQKRMHVSSAAAAARLAKSDPAVLLVFDVLHLDGRSLLGESYADRRAALAALELSGPAWQTPAGFTGSGAEAVRTSQEQQLEGVLAKRLASVYMPGRRSPDWIKVKNIRTQEVVIGGWQPGKGRREGTIGSLLLGVPADDGRLDYVGKVGTGFTDAMLTDLAGRLHRHVRATSPFADVPRPDARDARWVSPRLVGEVDFSEWTGDGRLRHPSWRGLRPDKEPGQVVRES